MLSTPRFAFFRNSALVTFAAIIGAGCAEQGLGPRESSLQSLTAGAMKLRGACTVSWVSPVSGMWTDPTRWSTNAVPGVGDEVCITVDGTYSVTVRGSQSVFGVTVGAAANVGEQTLVVQGTPSTATVLTAVDGLDNHGTVSIGITGSNAQSATLAVTNGVLHNMTTGRILTPSSAVGGNFISADVLNDGSVDISSPTTLTRAGGQFVNTGAMTVPDNFISANNGVFIQQGGTLTITGTRFQQTGGEFHFDGGSLTGSPLLMGVALNIGGASTATGTLTMRGASTLSGDVRQGQTILIQGVPGGSAGDASLTAASSFSNAGTILLAVTGSNPGSSTLAVTSGTLTNAGTGVIDVQNGPVVGQFITADVVNDGTILINTNTTLGRTDGRYVNNNTVTIQASDFLTVSNNGTFVQAAGTLSVGSNLYQQTGGAFELDGGTLTGTPVLIGVALDIGAGSTAQGTVIMHGASTIAGDVQPGQTVLVQGTPSSAAVLTAATNVSNSGLIRLATTGANAGPSTLATGDNTLTNTTAGRIEMATSSVTGPFLSGNVENRGVIALSVNSDFTAGTLRNVAPGTINGGRQLTLAAGTSFFGTGALTVNVNNSGEFNVGLSPGLLAITGTFVQTSAGSFNAEIAGTIPGTDFDRVTVSGSATLAGTLNVSTVGGSCVDAGVFEIMTFASRSGDFTVKNGLDLGGGRTVTTQPAATNYRLTVGGPPCIAPDITPPVITAQVSGPLGNNGWYTGNAIVTWQVTDAESPISTQTGCTETQVTDDTAGITFTCSATSAGGSASQSVTVKRDATAPVVNATRAPAANALGWNNTDVTATFTATDAMSGVDGSASATQVFSTEGTSQGGSRTFADLAGNTATAQIAGINIDKTAPAVSVTRQPLPDADGWNTTPVTVMYSATDALSGIQGDASFTQVFASEGANQGGSRDFTDRAGNSATATISGINIRQPPPPPPPPPPPMPLQLACSATPSQLWPPNGRMVPVSVAIRSHSDLTGAVISLLSVASNEPNSGPGPDIQEFVIGTNDLQGLLRAARHGSGHGRRYTLVYEVTAADQRRAECTVIVTVAHDRSRRSR